MITALPRRLASSLLVWMHIPPDGIDRPASKQHHWVPSLGIDYHLGIDGLGALMLLLSAIVTLMAIDAAHRVHQPAQRSTSPSSCCSKPASSAPSPRSISSTGSSSGSSASSPPSSSSSCGAARGAVRPPPSSSSTPWSAPWPCCWPSSRSSSPPAHGLHPPRRLASTGELGADDSPASATTATS